MNLISTEADWNVKGCAGIWSQIQVLEGSRRQISVRDTLVLEANVLRFHSKCAA